MHPDKQCSEHHSLTQPKSFWEWYEWLSRVDGLQPAANNASSVACPSPGEKNGNAAGTKSGTAARAAVASAARQRAAARAKVRPMIEHESYMATAAELALGHPANPFAALLVDRSSGEVLAEGVNSTRMNPLCHGEIVCINNAAQTLSRDDWKNTILYSTAEPCCMCQAAILWCRIPHVVYGTSIETLRSLGWDQFAMDAADVTDAAPFADCELTSRVLIDRCDALFQQAAKIRSRRLDANG